MASLSLSYDYNLQLSKLKWTDAIIVSVDSKD